MFVSVCVAIKKQSLDAFVVEADSASCRCRGWSCSQCRGGSAEFRPEGFELAQPSYPLPAAEQKVAFPAIFATLLLVSGFILADGSYFEIFQVLAESSHTAQSPLRNWA